MDYVYFRFCFLMLLCEWTVRPGVPPNTLTALISSRIKPPVHFVPRSHLHRVCSFFLWEGVGRRTKRRGLSPVTVCPKSPNPREEPRRVYPSMTNRLSVWKPQKYKLFYGYRIRLTTIPYIFCLSSNWQNGTHNKLLALAILSVSVTLIMILAYLPLASGMHHG